jgi:hypothetical protein
METRLRQRLFSNARVKLAAPGLAAAIWSTSFLSTETTVHTVSVPVQFVNGPSGTDISRSVGLTIAAVFTDLFTPP